jgi:ankyrin repeat protein
MHLKTAVQSGELRRVKYLVVESGIDPNEYKPSLIVIALQEGHLNVADFLWTSTEAKLDIDNQYTKQHKWFKKKRKNIIAYFRATHEGNWKAIQKCLKIDPGVRNGTMNNICAVHYAVSIGRSDIVTKLVENNVHSCSLVSLCKYAAGIGRIETVYNLVNVEKFGIVATDKTQEVLATLIDQRNKIHILTKSSSRHPKDSYKYFLLMVRELVIHNGMTTTERNHQFFQLVQFADVETLNFMIEEHGDVRLLFNGDTILMSLIKSTRDDFEKLAIIQGLIKEKAIGSTFNIQTKFSPLMVALEKRHERNDYLIARWLLSEKIVDVNEILDDTNERDALLVAAQKGKAMLIVNLLEIAQANIEVIDTNGESVWSIFQFNYFDLTRDSEPEILLLLRSLLLRKEPPENILEMLRETFYSGTVKEGMKRKRDSATFTDVRNRTLIRELGKKKMATVLQNYVRSYEGALTTDEMWDTIGQ